MDESPRLAEHYARRQYIYDDIDQDSQEDTGTYNGEVMWKNPDPLRGSQDNTHTRYSTIEVPRYLESNPLGSSLIYCLESKVRGRLIPLWIVGSFFQYLPARMGQSAALDAAVSCLCDLYQSPYNLRASFRQKYVRALSSLRSHLDNASLQMNPETLCASILLQMCEVSRPRCVHRSGMLLSAIIFFSSLEASIEDHGVNYHVERPLFSVLVALNDTKMRSTMQCWSLS